MCGSPGTLGSAQDCEEPIIIKAVDSFLTFWYITPHYLLVMLEKPWKWFTGNTAITSILARSPEMTLQQSDLRRWKYLQSIRIESVCAERGREESVITAACTEFHWWHFCRWLMALNVFSLRISPHGHWTFLASKCPSICGHAHIGVYGCIRWG